VITATNQNGHERLERVNIMLSREDRRFLDQFAAEIRQQSGGSVSNSEIVRAGLAAMRELHRIGADSRYGPVTAARKGLDLRVLAVMAVRRGVLRSVGSRNELHTSTPQHQPTRGITHLTQEETTVA
jgi:hypothetical protein